MEIKFTHLNIVARDYQKLAKFYEAVFGCEPQYPERDYSGAWLDALTNLQGAHLQGMHLRLPGHTNGPTLEIFQYKPEAGDAAAAAGSPPAINRPGLAHLAFQVDDVHHYLKKLLQHGGAKVGQTIEKEIQGVGRLTAVYARDPEGNIIEIQSWK